MSTRSVTETFKLALGTLLKRKNTKLIKSSVTKKPSGISPRVSAAPTALPLYDIISKLPSLFPRSVSDSLKDYEDFHEKGTETFQEELLMTLPFYRNDSFSKKAEVIKTVVDDEGNYINELYISPKFTSVPNRRLKHLIFIHGYGAGLGFFLKNLENIPLLNEEWCIHALDLPGYGFSSRCKFPFRYPKDAVEDVHGWFHQRIHKWFDKRNLLYDSENNLIMAHSLGAYLMALYTSKYPSHFKKLIMCSPAGICNSTVAATIDNLNPPWWYTKLWDLNVSPFSLVRNSSHLGSKLTSGWSYRRFSKLLKERTMSAESQFEALHRYAYAIFNKCGSGEYLLSFALRCGGDPRMPLEDTIFKDYSNGIKKSNCKWLWMYGDKDWMDVKGGRRVSKYLTEHLGQQSKVLVVPDAGHHLYFDNHNYFNEVIVNEMKSM